MSSKSFEWTFTVLESHLDTFGHMNHATYLQIFEQARWELITEGGFGLKKILETQVGPTILDLKIRYMRELRLRENIKITTICDDYRGGKIGKIRQTMTNDKNEVCTEMDLTVGLFDMKARKLIAATPEWLKAIGIT